MNKKETFTFYILFKAFGIIELLDYDNNEDKIWPVFSNCKSVHIKSAMFKTEEGWDFVTIGDIEYSGTAQIDRIVSTNFTV